MKNHKGLFALSALSVSLLLGMPSVHAADWKPGVPRTVYVNLFEWNWDDVAKECTNYLGPKGYKAVQVSPPQEHEQGNNEWWRRYQPASYKIESRSGNRQQFQNMVNTCKAAGVDIYADAVINHMAAQGGTGIAGSSWSSRSFPAVPYSSQDFHSPCDISGADYNNIGSRSNVLNCSMPGLPDLNTGSDYVRGKIADYLKDLQSLGVAGFRVDAAKHIHEDDIAGIFAKVPGDYFVTLEIIANATGSTPYSIINNYLQNGRTTNEFAFKALVKETFLKQNGKNIASIPSTWNSWEKVASNKATVFVNNHDEERQGCGSLSACNSMNNYNGQQYWLANVFMLANDYGYPQVMSGYNFNSHDQGRPNGGPYNGGNTPDGCSSNPSEMGKWNCTHRSNYVGNMVGFRNYVDGTAVANWQVDGTDRIAFSRGNKGFVAINNTGTQWIATLNTGLAEGSYCNVIKGELSGTTCTSDKITVNAAGQASINVPANDAIAIHIGQKEGGACTTNCGDTAAPSAPGLPTTTVTASSVALNWTTSTDNVAVTGYDIYRNGSLVGSSANPSYTDSNVPSGTHSYTIKAKDAAGNVSAASPAGSATVNGGTTTTATVYYNQTAKSWSTVNIHYRVGTGTWTAVPGAVMDTGCTVGSITYKKKAIDIGASQLEAVFNNGTSWDNQGNTSGSNYLIGTGVTIVNGNGTMTANATDPCGPTPDITAPTAPGTPTTSINGSSITLSWAAAIDAVGVTGYDVYRGTTLVGSSTSTSYTDSNVPAGTYSYTIKAKDAAGNISAASPAGSATISSTTDTLPPSVPSNLTSPSQSSNSINLAWGPSYDTGGSGGAGYNIYQANTLVASTTSLSYTVTGLAAGTAYNFSIKAKDKAGNVSAAATGQFSTKSGTTDTTPPSVPSNLTSPSQSSNSINLAWGPSYDTGGSGGAGYNIYQANTLVASTTSLSYTVTGLAAATAYNFSIKAKDKAGNVSAAATGQFSTKSGTTDTTPPSVPSNLTSPSQSSNSINLAWGPSYDTGGSGGAGYNIYQANTLVASTTSLSYTVTGLAAATAYNFSIKAKDKAGNVSAAATGQFSTTSGTTDTTPPTVPASLSIGTKTQTSLALSWNASTDASGVKDYDVFRGTTKVATVTGTSYTDTGLTADTTYSYQVLARDNSAAQNVSAKSTAVSGKTDANIVCTTCPQPTVGKYATNPNNQVGKFKTITLDGKATEWTEDMIIAQGVANDDPRIFLGSHEGPVYDLYALYGAWDDTNVYLMWQFTNVTDVVDPAQGYPISDNGKPWNGDIPQMIAFDTVPGVGTTGKLATETLAKTVWGMRVNFSNQEVDRLAMFSSKKGVGQPAIFKLNASNQFDYVVSNVLGFVANGIEFNYDKVGGEFAPAKMWGINKNGWAGYKPADLADSSKYIDFLTTTHSKAQDTVYEMKIPFAALGITKAQLETQGIGLMLLTTFGQSAIGSLPHDSATLDNATQPYSADASTSAEKEDYDLITAPFARLGKK